MQATQLKIAKYMLEVEVRDSVGREKKAAVYVAEEMTVDGRSERLQDIFDNRKFVPLRIEGQLELVSAAHLSWIRLDLIGALDELDPQAEQESGASSATVKIELEDGSLILGGVRWFLPASMRRVADYFQTAPRWIPVRTSDFLYLVNRDRIVRVVPVEG
jgi:hypothetical protein